MHFVHWDNLDIELDNILIFNYKISFCFINYDICNKHLKQII